MQLSTVDPTRAAVIMGSSGAVLTYGELDRRTNRLTRLFRSLGLTAGDHVALVLENHPSFHTVIWAAYRAGLYFTPISTRLRSGEVAHIVNDCDAIAVIASATTAGLVADALSDCPNVRHRLGVDPDVDGFGYVDALAQDLSTAPLTDGLHGRDMLYSSGTTGVPKGILRPLPEGDVPLVVQTMLEQQYAATCSSVYLSPAPLYHAAPLRFTMAMQCIGGTVVVMEHFDAEEALHLLEQHGVTHSQWVPTMFVKLLKLPSSVRQRFRLSSMTAAIHAAAPCPVAVKEQMLQWWGPIVYEYYGGSEGNGVVMCDPVEWIAHPGTVGRAVGCRIHVTDDTGTELSAGEVGTVWFESSHTFEYHKDPGKTNESRDPLGRSWTTLGDVGYLDADGYLYLTDRRSHMIITGGVNVYPQEAENVLVMHPDVADVAVFGIPDPVFGEQVKAVVQLVDPARHRPDVLEQELIEYCRQRLADYKCPRSIDFRDSLPREPTGKLMKRLLRDEYQRAAQVRGEQ